MGSLDKGGFTIQEYHDSTYEKQRSANPQYSFIILVMIMQQP